MSTTRKIVGLAAATGLGAYWLSGREGRRRREALRESLLQTRKDILDRLERFQDVNRETYCRLVDQVTQRYAALKRINSRELKELAADLKEAWRAVDWKAAKEKASAEAAGDEARSEEEQERQAAGF